MKLAKSLVMGVFMLSATSAMAAKEVGNGGNAVLCPATKSAELLDYYEARILRNMNVNVGTGKDPVAVAQFVVQRLKKVSPVRALAYEKYIQNFMNESRFLSGVELVEVDDSGHIFLPNNCRIVQVALQKAPEFPGDGRYVINKDVWDQMPVSSQAGLILHEIIYREALEFGAYDSKASRYINSILAANQITSYDQASFSKLMLGIGFKVYEDFGAAFILDPSDPTNLVLEQSEFFKPTRPPQVKIMDFVFDTSVPGTIYRDENGTLTGAFGAFKFLYQGQNLSLQSLFFNNGSPRRIVGFVDGSKIEFNFHGVNYIFYKRPNFDRYAFEVSPTGDLESVWGNMEIVNGNLRTPGMITISEGRFTPISKFGFPITDRSRIFFSMPTKLQTDQGLLTFKGGSEFDEIELFPDSGKLASGYLEGNQAFNGGTTCAQGARVFLNELGVIDTKRTRLDPNKNCFFN